MKIDNATKSVFGFIVKALAMTLPVLLPAIAYYLAADPFKVLYHYDNYYERPEGRNFAVGVNKGMVTIRDYNARKSEGARFNAFIFGASISCYYDARKWGALLGSDANPFHFDSSGESLEMMAEKVEYLDRQGDTIKYALVILDPIGMGTDSKTGLAYKHPPEISGGAGAWLEWHYSFFRASTNADFFKSWIPAIVTGESCFYGRSPIFVEQPIVYDRSCNQETLPEWDRMIATDSKGFYAARKLVASPDTLSVSAAVVVGERAEAVRRIAEVFRRHHTDYQIIIGPNRRKVCLNPSDYATLAATFAAARVHDYSASHATALECDTMLYDNTHYRPAFASRLLHRTYRK